MTNPDTILKISAFISFYMSGFNTCMGKYFQAAAMLAIGIMLGIEYF